MSDVDPQSLLFTVPTVADDLPSLEPCLTLDDDRWRQIEFFDADRLDEIKRVLTDLKAYVSEHTQGEYWNGCYVRKLAPVPVIPGASALAEIEAVLVRRAGAAPLITSFAGNQRQIGRVGGGFTFAMGGGVDLYGVQNADGVQVFCAHVDVGGDNAILTRLFLALHAAKGLLLVDWQSQMLLVSVNAAGRIYVWSP
jgi:hypothetical protein